VGGGYGSNKERTIMTTEADYDDFTVISGIKEPRQDWLRKKCKVRTYADLAALSAKSIVAQLKADGKPYSRNLVETWIAEAKELAARTELVLQQNEDTPNVQAGQEANSPDPPADKKKWKWLGVFVVEFRILQQEDLIKKQEVRVRSLKFNEETGNDWKDDNGDPKVVAGVQLYPWMVDQLPPDSWPMPEAVPSPTEQAKPSEDKLSDETTTEPSAIGVETDASLPVQVEVTQIRVFQPADTEAPIGVGVADQPFSGHIASGEPFTLEVTFRLPESAAAELARRGITYNIEFYVPKFDPALVCSSGLNTLTDPVKSTEEWASYTDKLPPATFQPGMYRAGVLVIFQSTPPSAGYLEVPLIQVV
jgi:hypothetical protein